MLMSVTPPALLPLAPLRQQLPAWTVEPDGKGLRRRFEFADFPQAFAFMTQMAFHAERHDHHPEWFNVHRTLDVRLSTHDAGGLTQRDLDWALAADRLFAQMMPAAAAPRADFVVDQQWASYTAAEHAVWKTLFERQFKLLPGRACDAFIEGMKALPMSAEQIPNFEEMNQVLMQRTGWQVVAVPGLVPDEVFFEHLAHRRFPAGRFIRPIEQLDYLQEPDIFHDVFGHVPMLMNPVMADFIQAYGQGGLRAQSLGMLAPLARVYWYTVEFGLVRQAEGLRIYGAGIASSLSETRFCLEDASPNHLRFDLERVLRTEYRIDDFQESYFVLDSLDQLLELARIDFAPLYQRIGGQPVLRPGQVCADAECLRRGTGTYHHGPRDELGGIKA